MTQEYIDGAQSRGNGKRFDTMRTLEWQQGWQAMDSHIQSMLNNSRAMFSELRILRQKLAPGDAAFKGVRTVYTTV